MNSSKHFRRLLHIVIPLAVMLSGCTEDKALALKSAASQYRDQAARGLKLSADGIRRSTSMPPVSPEKIIKGLQDIPPPMTAIQVEFLLKSDQALLNTASLAVKQVTDLEEKIATLTSVFDNLPQGSYLSTDQVRQTLPFAVKLNLSLLNIAQMVELGEMRMVENARRIEVIEGHKAVYSLPISQAKEIAFQKLSKEIIDLSVAEKERQLEAQVAVLQAAELGNSLINLAKDYDKVSIADVLGGLKDALNLASRISPESGSIKQALTRLQASTKAWQDDPVLKPLLTQHISK